MYGSQFIASCIYMRVKVSRLYSIQIRIYKAIQIHEPFSRKIIEFC